MEFVQNSKASDKRIQPVSVDEEGPPKPGAHSIGLLETLGKCRSRVSRSALSLLPWTQAKLGEC